MGQGVERDDGVCLAGKERFGPDYREQPDRGVQEAGRGDGTWCLVLEQAHQWVHQGRLVPKGGDTAQVLRGNEGQGHQVYLQLG